MGADLHTSLTSIIRIIVEGAFRSILEQSGIEPVRLPPHSPNINAYIELFIRSLRAERLERLIFFGEGPLRNAVSEFLGHTGSACHCRIPRGLVCWQEQHKSRGDKLLATDGRWMWNSYSIAVYYSRYVAEYANILAS